MLNLFRATQKEEIQGLDILKHNEPAYPMGKILFGFLHIFKSAQKVCSYIFLFFYSKFEWGFMNKRLEMGIVYVNEQYFQHEQKLFECAHQF